MSEPRIALLLTGTIGKIYTNKRSYDWSEDVDYRIALEHYRKNMFDVNPNIDVFIHCWDKKYEKQVIEDYNPKMAQFQDQINFPERFTPSEPFDDRTLIRRMYNRSRWYSTAKVAEMKRSWEKTNNFTYDYVMTSRLDCAFLKEFKFTDYNSNQFWAPKDDVNLDICNTRKLFLDYWFFSNSENMDKFNSLYFILEDLDKAKFEKTGKGMNAHEDSWIWANNCNFDIQYTLDESVDHDLVRAIYEDCHYQGEEFSGIETLTKYDKYPRDNGRF